MEYKGSSWHETCFTCQRCQQPIGTKSFIPKENQNFCVPCYEKQYALQCVQCKKVLGIPWGLLSFSASILGPTVMKEHLSHLYAMRACPFLPCMSVLLGVCVLIYWVCDLVFVFQREKSCLQEHFQMVLPDVGGKGNSGKSLSLTNLC